MRMVLLIASLVMCSLGGDAFAAPASTNVPAAPVLVSPKDLRSRPEYISGTPIDEVPEVKALAGIDRYGRAVFEATVLPEGTLNDFVVIESTHVPMLDAAIAAALRNWKLSSPIDKYGNKVATRAKFPLGVGTFPKQLVGGEAPFPLEAKTAFNNGTVRVGFEIDPSGMPIKLVVERSSHSDILDKAVVANVGGFRFYPPKDLNGAATSLHSSFQQDFSQALGTDGTFLSGMKNYRCATFIAELTWWRQANPGLADTQFKLSGFVAGIAAILPESLGWRKMSANEYFMWIKPAWEKTVESCRTAPDSTFVEQYRKAGK